ncbi:MAG TPA: hypothetical protein V6C89_19905 [Drouetiella sp.]|jgi:hypothetical protein
MQKSVAVVAALMGWLGLLAIGTTISATYENEPGDRGFPPSQVLPTAAEMPQNSKGGYQLIMFVHPKCPCTRASMSELRKLMQNNPDLKATIYFYRPSNEEAGWEKSDIWKTAESIKNATLRVDIDGKKASAYRIVTSGEILLYDANQHLVFSGGITGARGHVGDNISEDMLEDALMSLSKPDQAPRIAPVFGCRILKNGSKLCEVSQSPTAASE